jgi:hypothetical protein
MPTIKKSSSKNYTIIAITYLTATLAFVFLYFFMYFVSGKIPVKGPRVYYFLQMASWGVFSTVMYYSIYLLHIKNVWGVKFPFLAVTLLALWMIDMPALLILPISYFFLSRHPQTKEYFKK